MYNIAKLKRKKEKRSEQIIYTNDFLKSVEELNKSILLMNNTIHVHG